MPFYSPLSASSLYLSMCLTVAALFCASAFLPPHLITTSNRAFSSLSKPQISFPQQTFFLFYFISHQRASSIINTMRIFAFKYKLLFLIQGLFCASHFSRQCTERLHDLYLSYTSQPIKTSTLPHTSSSVFY